MEAKVDVRKLQILNDRINQTIEALNQVRLSVHGLGHSGLQNPFPGQGYGLQQGMGVPNPYLSGTQTPGQGLGGPFSQLHNQFGQQGVPGMGGGQGFQHSPFAPQLQSPFVNPFATQNMASPWGQAGQQTPFTGQQTPFMGQQGGFGGVGGGLFHSSPDVIDRQIAELRASDPQRITQTFPYVGY
jgi:hypothetical protein